MKLIKCHIDAFGCLQNFDKTFNEGLTVIREPNGAGKSTLAAFIKAMLYGMPKSIKKKLTENDWKRYEPWEGGRYGGYIEFEAGGRKYRATRHFEKANDFSLMDLNTRHESTRFSKNLGIELFELDAESFSHSTYMPQLSGNGSFNQESIHAKLGQLVNDTDDLNSYENAREALKNRRKKYKNLNNTGGSIRNLEYEIYNLTAAISEAEEARKEFTDSMEELDSLNAKKQEKTRERDELREKIRAASERERIEMLRNRKLELEQSLEDARNEQNALDRKYPKGYPDRAEIKKQNGHLEQLRGAQEELDGLDEPSDEDRAVVKEGAKLFSDKVAVEQDISACRDNCAALNKLETLLSSKELQPAERERMDALKAVFKDGVPSDETLAQYRSRAADLAGKRKRNAEPLLSPNEQQAYDSLRAAFPDGLPTEDELNGCDALQKQREECERDIAGLSLSAGDADELRALEQLFSSGVPSEDDLQNIRQTRRRILELNAKKDAAASVTRAPGKPSPAPLVLGIAGAVLLAAGVASFLLAARTPGIILGALGLASLVAALLLRVLRKGDGAEDDARVITVSAISREELKELRELNEKLRGALTPLYPDLNDAEIDDRIDALAESRKTYLRLKDKKIQNEASLAERRRELSDLESRIHSFFERYYRGQDFREDFMTELRRQSMLDANLEQTLSERKSQRETLSGEIKALEDDIKTFLERYGHNEAAAEDPQDAVHDVSNECAEFARLTEKARQYESAASDAKPRRAALCESITGALKRYNVFNPDTEYEDNLKTLQEEARAFNDAKERITSFDKARQTRERAQAALDEFMKQYSLKGAAEDAVEEAGIDITRREEISRNLESTGKEYEKFMKENPTAGSDAEELYEDDLPGSEELKKEEQEKLKELDGIEERLRKLRETRDRSGRKVEQIPAWEDQVARLKTQKDEQEENLMLLDRTIELLEQAKTNLAESYIGKLEEGFARYSNDLLQGELGRVYVDNELGIRIEKLASPREVDSFSAGLIDCIMICMRLSLVDTLFPKEQPFLILDDPFVNLDDEHTERARAMLDEIAKTHQVIYLICNTSRE